MNGNVNPNLVLQEAVAKEVSDTILRSHSSLTKEVSLESTSITHINALQSKAAREQGFVCFLPVGTFLKQSFNWVLL